MFHVLGRTLARAGVGPTDALVDAYRLEGETFEYFDDTSTDTTGDYVLGRLPAGTCKLEFYDLDAQVGEFWNDKTSQTRPSAEVRR